MNRHPPRILLTDDLASDDDRNIRVSAVRRAALVLAKRLGLSVDIVHVDDPEEYLAWSSPIYASLIDRFFARPGVSLVRRSELGSVTVRSMFISGSPAEKLISLTASGRRYELVVIGTHGRHGLRRFLAGGVAEQVIRNARIPVMTVGPAAVARIADGAQPFGGKTGRSILVPIAPGERTSRRRSRAEGYARYLARRLHARIVRFAGDTSLGDEMDALRAGLIVLPADEPSVLEIVSRSAIPVITVGPHSARQKAAA